MVNGDVVPEAIRFTLVPAYVLPVSAVGKSPSRILAQTGEIGRAHV